MKRLSKSLGFKAILLVACLLGLRRLRLVVYVYDSQ